MLDLIHCGKVKMVVPLQNNKFLRAAKRLSLEGIDMFDSTDSFFNDFCYPYYNENGDDVIMSDRRKNYFQNESLCSSG